MSVLQGFTGKFALVVAATALSGVQHGFNAGAINAFQIVSRYTVWIY